MSHCSYYSYENTLIINNTQGSSVVYIPYNFVDSKTSIKFNTLRVLFCIASMLKSRTSIMLNRSMPYSIPKTSSSHFADTLREYMVWGFFDKSSIRTQIWSETWNPTYVIYVSSVLTNGPITQENRYHFLQRIFLPNIVPVIFDIPLFYLISFRK